MNISDKIIKDNKELIRILADIDYPADIQRNYLRIARRQIRELDPNAESKALPVQDEVIAWEKRLIQRNNHW